MNLIKFSKDKMI